MSNLYSSLLTYKAKEGRTPLEEFTSGALADLLSRMGAERLAAFLQLFRRWDQTSVTLPDDLWGCDIVWETEHSVWSKDGRWGRADIIGLVRGQPVIVIENKLSAEVSPTQIALYHDALADSNLTQPLLLFLTATTEPPQEFRQQHEHKITYAAARWATVYQFLTGIADPSDNATALEALSFEFSRFLEEQELHMDLMSAKDTAVLHLWLTAKERVDNTVLAIFNPICSALSPWRKGTRGTNFSDDSDTYAYNVSFRIDGRERWAYLEAGIVYPDQSDWWAVADKSSPQVVVFIFDYNEEPLPRLKSLDWAVSPDGDQMAVMCDLNDMLADPSEAHAKLENWSRKVADQLVKALPSPG